MYYTNDTGYGKVSYGKTTAGYGSTSYDTTRASSSVNYSVNTKAMCGKGCSPCIGCKFIY